MVKRRGMGKGKGKGYKNMIPNDHPVHVASGRGEKQPQGFNEAVLKRLKNPKKKNEAQEEFISLFGEQTLNLLEETLGSGVSEISPDMGRASIELEDGREYMVFKDDDDAEDYARDIVEEQLRDEPELFNQDWLQGFYYMSDTDKRVLANDLVNMRLDVDNEDLQDYFDSDEEEQFEKLTDAIDNSNQKGEVFDLEIELEQLYDKVRERLQREWYDEFYDKLDKDAFGFLVNEEGLYSKEDFYEQNFVQIDIEEAAEDAINVDGWEHFVATYDGESVKLFNGVVLARTG